MAAPNDKVEILQPPRRFTANEVDRISDQLGQNLGPEFVSTRPGDGGRPAPYIEGHRVIQVANEIFGFDGWSSQILERKVEVSKTEGGKHSVAISCHMRITLKDGTFREDCGLGHSVNSRSLLQAHDKATKSAITDAMKRTFRQFGSALGGCLYDKDYIASIRMVPCQKREFKVEDLRRPGEIKKRKVEPLPTKVHATKSDPSALPAHPTNSIASVTAAGELSPLAHTSDFFIDSEDDMVWPAELNQSPSHKNDGNPLATTMAAVPAQTKEVVTEKAPEVPAGGATPELGNTVHSTPQTGINAANTSANVTTPMMFVQGRQANLIQSGHPESASEFDLTFRSPHMKVNQSCSRPLHKAVKN